MLRSLSLKPVYDSSECDLVRDLIVPLLQSCNDYLRGVGFFSSGWLRVASAGMCALVEREGRARIVISPVLSPGDWEALKSGQKARNDERLKGILRGNIEELRASLETETLNSLAWLVADGYMEFRFAVPKDRTQVGDYHDKVGVFIDEQGDCVAIHGSFNDSVQGTLNGEAFSVFKSWDAGQQPFVHQHRGRLLRLWNTGNSQFDVYSIPDAIREQFIKLRTTASRPYEPFSATLSALDSGQPRCPIALRSFQAAAVEAWEKAGCRGVLEMATGTGKTATALAAAVCRHDALGRLALIILVPYQHLLEQWQKTCRAFGFNPRMCSSAHRGWDVEVKSVVQDFRLGALPSLCLLAVHNTAASERFLRIVSTLPPERTMLVADEVHNLGSRVFQAALVEQAKLRLGLSATPRRWFDEQGTQAIFSYFNGVCFEYALEAAIGHCLVPYEYNPILVNLSDDEMTHFEQLTRKITSVAGRAEDDPDMQVTLKRLLIERSRILASARNKLPELVGLLRGLLHEKEAGNEELQHALIYCAPGTHRDVLAAVAGLGLRCHEFVHTVSLEQREKVISEFSRGDIQALIAVKCLDEGVDVPSTELAFFLASTSNPREFVQRRGRILRRAPGKSRARVFDLIVTPSEKETDVRSEFGASILRREMPRFAEFSSLAINQFQARAVA